MCKMPEQAPTLLPSQITDKVPKSTEAPFSSELDQHEPEKVLYTQHSEPILLPKLQIYFADFPYLLLSINQRLLTLETWCGYRYECLSITTNRSIKFWSIIASDHNHSKNWNVLHPLDYMHQAELIPIIVGNLMIKENYQQYCLEPS